MTTPREAGFTLVELMIALALFGLIAVAGLALVQSILDIQQGTSGRLERLADMRRVALLLDADLTQVEAGPIIGGGDVIAFRRHVRGAALPVTVRYALARGALTRSIDPAPPRALLDRIASARWRFYDPSTGWLDRWPPSPERAAGRPAAVELVLSLPAGGRGLYGTLRKVVALPTGP